VVAAGVGHRLHDGGEAVVVGQQRRDVLEDDAGLRMVGDVPHQTRDRLTGGLRVVGHFFFPRLAPDFLPDFLLRGLRCCGRRCEPPRDCFDPLAGFCFGGRVRCAPLPAGILAPFAPRPRSLRSWTTRYGATVAVTTPRSSTTATP